MPRSQPDTESQFDASSILPEAARCRTDSEESMRRSACTVEGRPGRCGDRHGRDMMRGGARRARSTKGGSVISTTAVRARVGVACTAALLVALFPAGAALAASVEMFSPQGTVK